MKTKIINLKQFRQNITKLWKEARKDNIRYIVMFHSTPILEVLPCMDEHLSFETNIKPERSHKKIDGLKLEFYKEEKATKDSGSVISPTPEAEKPDLSPEVKINDSSLEHINLANEKTENDQLFA